MMNDLIRRQDAMQAVESLCIDCDFQSCRFCKVSVPTKDDAMSKLLYVPAADPERKIGKWIDGKDERFTKCSECEMETTKNELMGISLFGRNEPNFCPCCGAKMVGERE